MALVVLALVVIGFPRKKKQCLIFQWNTVAICPCFCSMLWSAHCEAAFAIAIYFYNDTSENHLMRASNLLVIFVFSKFTDFFFILIFRFSIQDHGNAANIHVSCRFKFDINLTKKNTSNSSPSNCCFRGHQWSHVIGCVHCEIVLNPSNTVLIFTLPAGHEFAWGCSQTVLVCAHTHTFVLSSCTESRVQTFATVLPAKKNENT